MSNGNYILSFDFGTSGVKAALTSSSGKLLVTVNKQYELHMPEINYAEQDVDDYWKAACLATRELLTLTEIDPESIEAISLCSQGMGLIPLDKQGKPLRRNIIWLDNRAGEQAKQINEKMGSQHVTAASVVAKMLWLSQNEKHVFDQTCFFADCTGYIVYRMTGNLYMELTNSSPYSLDMQQLETKNKLYDTAGVSLSRIPPLKICTEYVGNVTRDAAREMGITTHTKVYMGSGDVPTAAAGAGCVSVGDAHICLASSGWLSVLTEDQFYPHLSPGVYQIYSINRHIHLYGGGVQSVGAFFEWGISQFYRSEKTFQSNNIYQLIEEEVRIIPPGCNGLIATPWLYGESCPISDDKVKALFFNFSSKHDRRYFLRAIMESVCFSLRWQMEYYHQDTGLGITELSAIGGCATNDIWLQMAADVLGVKISVPPNVLHAGAHGSAMIAGIGHGTCSFASVRNWVSQEKLFIPRRIHKTVYDKQYAVFKKLYDSLKPHYHELNAM